MESRKFSCNHEEDYSVELLTDVNNRKEELVDMLIDNFLHDETLVKSLRLRANSKDFNELENLKEDEKLLMSTVIDKSKLIVIALHKETNRISGALLIIIHEREKEFDENLEEEKEKHTKNVNKKPKPYEGQLKSDVIKEFFDQIVEIEELANVNIFVKYPHCKYYAEFELIGINKLDRRKGLALDLYKAGLTLVKELPEVNVLYGKYTSLYSKVIAQKIGKKIISNVDVLQLKDKSGNPVFQDTKPHNIVSFMAMEV